MKQNTEKVNQNIEKEYDELDSKFKRFSDATFKKLKILMKESPPNIIEIQSCIDRFIDDLKTDQQQYPTPITKMIERMMHVKETLKNQVTNNIYRTTLNETYVRPTGGRRTRRHRTRRHRIRRHRTRRH
jgi:hypothetical protein